MAFQRVPDTAMFTFLQSRGLPFPGDYPILTSVYVRNTVLARTTSYFTTICNSLVSWWDQYVQPLVSTSINLSGVTYRDLNNEFGEAGLITSSLVGTGAGEISAGFASVLFNLVCDPGLAPRRGRMYMAPPMETHVDPGGDSLTVAGRAAWQDALDNLSNAAAAFGTDAMVVVSRYENGALRPEAATNTLLSTTVNGLLASQTRRRRLR